MQSYIRNQPEWSDLVNSITNVNHYLSVVEELFEDGVFNNGRLFVLRVFTIDVCCCIPRDKNSISEVYNIFIRTIREKHMPHLTLDKYIIGR